MSGWEMPASMLVLGIWLGIPIALVSMVWSVREERAWRRRSHIAARDMSLLQAQRLAAQKLPVRVPGFEGGVGAGAGEDPYDRLLILASYDRDVVERLIDHERSRSPAGNRNQWIRDALERWERDRR